jgi:hypothetical protein
MDSLEERGISFVKKYINENFKGNKSDNHLVDRWVDSQICCHRMKHFEMNTANDLMEAMNYVNKHNNNYNVFSAIETVENVKHEFLREIICVHKLI